MARRARLAAWRGPRWGPTTNRLILATAVLFAARLGISLLRSGPTIVGDELGYLGNARALAGGLEVDLEHTSYYRGGYSLLIAPILEFISDPEVAYHLVLVLNAALAASLLPLLYLLLSRFCAVPAGTAFWAALAGAAYPALTILSQIAMSENALFVGVCVWLIAFAGLLEAGRLRRGLPWAIGLAAATTALSIVHNRMIVAVGLTVLALVWLAARRRIAPSAAIAALAVIAVGAFAVHELDEFLIDANYGGEARNEGSQRLGDLFAGHGPLTAAANLFGQAWYLLVASFGLVAALATGAVARDPDGNQRGAVVLLALGLAGLLLLESAAAFPIRTRPDMLVYGRYVEIVTPPLIALGIACLARPGFASRYLRPALAALAALTAAVVLIRLSAEDPGTPTRWNISALPFVTSQLGPAILIGAALVAAAGALFLRFCARTRPELLGLAAVALFLPIVGYGIWHPVIKSEQTVYPTGWSSPEPIAARYGIETIGYDRDHYDVIGQYVTQWFLPDTSLRTFAASRRPPPSHYVLSSADWPREHRGTRARAIWDFAGRDQVLWRLGG